MANTKEKAEYIFSGSVMQFGREVYRNWTARTHAVSEGKAKSQLTYRYKVENKLAPSASIQLDGRLTRVDPVTGESTITKLRS